MGKTNEQLQEEIAKLNLEIKMLKTRSSLESKKAKAKSELGMARISKAKAIHKRRKVSFNSLVANFRAKGYEFGQASKKASELYNRL